MGSVLTLGLALGSPTGRFTVLFSHVGKHLGSDTVSAPLPRDVQGRFLYLEVTAVLSTCFSGVLHPQTSIICRLGLRCPTILISQRARVYQSVLVSSGDRRGSSKDTHSAAGA